MTDDQEPECEPNDNDSETEDNSDDVAKLRRLKMESIDGTKTTTEKILDISIFPNFLFNSKTLKNNKVV